MDPILLPDATPELTAEVIRRGLEHAMASGHETIALEVAADDRTLREILLARGFEESDDAIVEAWLESDTRPAVGPLAEGYRLRTRRTHPEGPHHLAARNGPDVEARLAQTSLYRPELDLVVVDADGAPAASGLFWFDPHTTTGLVEPMRTEEDHQQRGLARHVLTSGIELLATAGATRVKICFEPDNEAARNLYLGVGFVPVRQTVELIRRPA